MKKQITLLALVCALFFSNQANAQDPFIGEIRMFGGNFAPQGWAKCEGQLLPINQYSALFSLLGTYYGGDGQTTFGLPDLRGRIPIGPGNGPGLNPVSLGEKAGSNQTYIAIANMPSHSHTVNATTNAGDSSVPTNNYPAETKLLDKEYSSGGLATTMNPNMIGNSGGSQPVNNMQPYQSVTFIIALYGIYPSQSKLNSSAPKE